MLLPVAQIIDTTIDYSGHFSLEVFVWGCNLNCWFCFNKDIICNIDYRKQMHISEIVEYLGSTDSCIYDGFVINGGEPLIYPNTIRLLCESVKDKYGLPIKIFTNGTNFATMVEFVNANLVDAIEIGLKSPPIAGKQIHVDAVINQARALPISVKFRYVVIPESAKTDEERAFEEKIRKLLGDKVCYEPMRSRNEITRIKKE